MDRFVAFAACGAHGEAFTSPDPAPSATLRALRPAFETLPTCPEPGCGAALRGVYRYDYARQAAATALEPAQLEALERTYRDEAAAEMAAGLATAVAERLRARLAGPKNRRDPLRPLLQRLLGEALFRLGELRGAAEQLDAALQGTQAGELRAEAAYFSTLCMLGGKDSKDPANAAASAQLVPLTALRNSLEHLESLADGGHLSPSSSLPGVRAAAELLPALRNVLNARAARAQGSHTFCCPIYYLHAPL